MSRGNAAPDSGDAAPLRDDERFTLTLPLTKPPTFEHPEEGLLAHSLLEVASEMAAEAGFKGEGCAALSGSTIFALVS